MRLVLSEEKSVQGLTGEAVKVLKGYDWTSAPHVLIGNLLGT